VENQIYVIAPQGHHWARKKKVNMQLPSTNIFLDTEVFVAANYNCQSERFKTIIAYAKTHDIKVFITDVVDREMRARIASAVDHAYDSLAKVRDGTRVLNNDDDFRMATRQDRKDAYKHKLYTTYESFLKDAQVEKLDSSKVKAGPIMDIYFESKPPFNKPDKKHEFPDAVNVQCIADWTTKNNTNAILVSMDKDVLELVTSMGAQTRIAYFRSIEELISKIVATKEYEAEIEAAIQAARNSFREQLTEMVSDANISVRRFDAEVEEKSLLSYNITSVNVLRAEEDYALCECEFEIEFEMRITYDDQGSFWWDSEEREAYYPTKKHSTKSKIEYFYLEVELTRPDVDSEWTVDLLPSSLSKSFDIDLD
jgi:predicted nuclease of predicted toxin-antitoxin system